MDKKKYNDYEVPKTPMMQQPAIQQPAMQQPMMQQPATQQPMMQQPAMQQPMMQQPTMQQPMMQQPGVQRPMPQRPMMQQPGMYGCPMMQGYGMPATMPGSYMPTEDMDVADERDIEYMKKMYPEICKKIQYYIDEEVDKMEYDGSPLYDEYPDRETMEQMVDRIYDTVEQENPEVELEDMDEGMTRQFGGRRRVLRGLVGALLLNEVFRRRRGYRRRRPYYGSYYDQYYNYPGYYDYGYDYDDYYPYY